MASVEKNRKCANQSNGKACNNIGKHLCSGCGEEIYCSKDCQKTHWPDHKVACKSASIKSSHASQAITLDSLSIKQLKNIMKAKAATYDGKKKAIVHAQLDNIIEKPSLLKFVQEHVQPSEIESLLSIQPQSVGGSNDGTTNTSSSSSGSKAKIGKPSNNPPTPTPEQMREQAKMMRKNPDMVRRANEVFKNMTDEQIRAYADQLEQIDGDLNYVKCYLDKAASDPQMMNEVLRMSKLSEKDRNKLQHIQEGLSGTKPMDAKWIDSTITILKQKPDIFKTMLKGKGAVMGGITDEQVNGFIDYMSSLDASILKMIFNFLIFLGRCYNPIVSLYNTVDSYTFGSARYIVLILVGIVVYYSSVIAWYCMKWIFIQLFAMFLFMKNLLLGTSTTSLSSSTDVSSDNGISKTLSADISANVVPNVATAAVNDEEFDF